jgi:hypothetical protein
MDTTESFRENVIILSIVVLVGVFSLVKLKVQAQDSNPQASKNTGATLASLDKARTINAESSATYVTEIPPGYRDWKVVSVAHEAGDLNDIRAILGNDIAIKAYREGTLPFPEGAIVGRIAWSYVPSEENNKTFGRDQSFVAGSPTDFYLQFIVKDSKKYAATGGWGYSSFGKDGQPTAAASMQSCFPCHQAISSRDFVFTRYSP